MHIRHVNCFGNIVFQMSSVHKNPPPGEERRKLNKLRAISGYSYGAIAVWRIIAVHRPRVNRESLGDLAGSRS